MIFELIAPAVVAAFVSCLYPIVRGFFRDLAEIGSAMPVSRLATARRFGQQEHRAQKAQRRPGGRDVGRVESVSDLRKTWDGVMSKQRRLRKCPPAAVSTTTSVAASSSAAAPPSNATEPAPCRKLRKRAAR